MGTKIIERPSCLFSPFVVRQTTSTWSEMWALEMKTFCPLMTKPPLERSALVLRLPTSEPASGSVMAIASTDPEERERLIKEVQVYFNEKWLFPYVYNIGLTMAQVGTVQDALAALRSFTSGGTPKPCPAK